MSSILKALRKLEEEKRGGKLEAPELRVDQGQPVTKPGPLVPLAVGILFGAVVVGLFFLWSTESTQERDNVQNVTQAPVAPVTSQAHPVPQVVVDQQTAPETAKTLQQPSLAAPVKSETEFASIANETSVPGAVREPTPVPEVAQEPVRQTKETVPLDTEEPVRSIRAVEKPEAPQQGIMLPEGINLIVTEVFYQDAFNSMAVVNDLPVMVGSHIDSAVVTEIHADRVLFEIDGKVYSVPVPLP